MYAEYAAALDLRSDVHQGILKGGYRKLGDNLQVTVRIGKISGKLYDILRHTAQSTEMLAVVADCKQLPLSGFHAWQRIKQRIDPQDIASSVRCQSRTHALRRILENASQRVCA